jgi:peptidoglycan/LPS O-acetylase OafA/YrhL
VPTLELTEVSPSRMHFVDALRSVAATVIAWHHFAWYGPLSEYALPVIGGSICWFANYGRVAVQVFFVLGGYVMARGMTKRNWSASQVRKYIAQRYCRLGLPYLAAIGVAIGACALGRNYLPSEVVDPPPNAQLILAHVFFLHKILGYDSLSAGLWFVGVNFQLSLVFVGLLFLREKIASTLPAGSEIPTATMMLIGWLLATSSLFYFNIGDRWENWFIYFYVHFFMGVLVFYGLEDNRGQLLFGLYALMVVVALAYHFRLHLVVTLLTGLILFSGGKLGIMDRWPRSRVIDYLGRTSYSLFLVHFPVLVIVATIWTWLGWTDPWTAAGGLIVAYAASLAASFAFHRVVEGPADQLVRSFNGNTEGK